MNRKRFVICNKQFEIMKIQKKNYNILKTKINNKKTATSAPTNMRNYITQKWQKNSIKFLNKSIPRKNIKVKIVIKICENIENRKVITDII